MPIGLLPICAGMAVREGMDPMQALAAITIYPVSYTHLDVYKRQGERSS